METEAHVQVPGIPDVPHQPLLDEIERIFGYGAGRHRAGDDGIDDFDACGLQHFYAGDEFPYFEDPGDDEDDKE